MRPRRPKLDAPGGDARIARLISGAVAQLGERRVRNAKVEGSIPFRSTISPFTVLQCWSIRVQLWRRGFSLLDVRVLDHLIIADAQEYSFAETGLL